MSTNNYITKTDLSNTVKVILGMFSSRENADIELQEQIDTLVQKIGLHYKGTIDEVPTDPEDQELWYVTGSGFMFWSELDNEWKNLGEGLDGDAVEEVLELPTELENKVYNISGTEENFVFESDDFEETAGGDLFTVWQSLQFTDYPSGSKVFINYNGNVYSGVIPLPNSDMEIVYGDPATSPYVITLAGLADVCELSFSLRPQPTESVSLKVSTNMTVYSKNIELATKQFVLDVAMGDIKDDYIAYDSQPYEMLSSHTYNISEYAKEEVNAMFSETPEELEELSQIIADNLKSKYKLWSSQKTSDEIAQAILESHAYADGLIGSISSISLEVVKTLPSMGESNIIYILQQADKNTLNVYSNDSWVEVGDLDVDFSDYYNRTTIDDKLKNKADKDSVLTPDDVVQNLDNPNGTDVLSTFGTNEIIKDINTKIDVLSSLFIKKKYHIAGTVLSHNYATINYDIDMNNYTPISIIESSSNWDQYLFCELGENGLHLKSVESDYVVPNIINDITIIFANKKYIQ